MILDIGEFDHHQKYRNGKRPNGIYYSSIGLLWKKFGENYLKQNNVENSKDVFNYMDSELIQYIDATDNMQFEYLENKITPDFIKLCNPEWNENLNETDAFLYAVRLGDSFWNMYIKHAIAEVKASKIILEKVANSKENYVIFDCDMPYRKTLKYIKNNDVKYFIFKSKRECYDIRTIFDNYKFANYIVKNSDNINLLKNESNIDLLYVDTHGKLCCTKKLKDAIKLIKYNDYLINKRR